MSDRFGLYLHIPFCVRKCPYCDFNTFDVDKSAMREFLAALRDELTLMVRVYDVPRADTLYIGGGTPTVLSGSQLAEVIDWVQSTVGLAEGAEVTVEANPGSVTVKGLRAMVASGVTRLSLGVQSFSDELLQRLGRNHTARDTRNSFEMIRAAGITNVNFDLMYALPGQTLEDWDRTLEESIQLGPEHLSCYSLIIEEGTPFATLHRKGALELPADDDEAAMYERTIAVARDAGYDHYEVSNFARPGFRSRHNLLYWRNMSWLGLGPGAHSYWQGRRFWNERSLSAYVGRVTRGELPVAGEEVIGRDAEMDETMMLGLRLTEGVSRREFAERFGVDVLEVYPETIATLVDWGLLAVTDLRVRLTERGRMIGNRVFAAFLRS